MSAFGDYIIRVGSRFFPTAALVVEVTRRTPGLEPNRIVPKFDKTTAKQLASTPVHEKARQYGWRFNFGRRSDRVRNSACFSSGISFGCLLGQSGLSLAGCIDLAELQPLPT